MRWIGLIGIVATASGALASSVPLSIGLETSWPAPPLLLELLETIYDEDPNAYFPFLEHLTAHLPPSSSRKPEETFETALDLIATHKLLPNALSHSTFKLALGLHTSVPRIEAAYSWYESYVNEGKLDVEKCEGSWVEWRGKGFCDVDALSKDMELSIEEGHRPEEGPNPDLSFDRKQAGPGAKHLAVFYMDIESENTLRLYNYLVSHSQQYPSFGFTVLYRPSKARRSKKAEGQDTRRTGLSGYGVELALKNTDYLVVDDRASTNSGNATNIPPYAKTQDGQDIFTETLGSDPWSELSTPLTNQELRDIGLKAATLIMSSKDKLRALLELSQDFPKYSAALARNVQVSPDIQRKVPDMMAMGPADTAIYINGKAFAPGKGYVKGNELNAFSLLKNLRIERNYIRDLMELGLTARQAFELLSDPIIGETQTETDPAEGSVDASDRLEGGQIITWWNDLEKDKRYKSWPSNIKGYARPMYQGQLHQIRRNTWNLVFVLDLSSVPALDTVASVMTTMIQRGLPVRFGVVPMISDDDEGLSRTMAKVFLSTVEKLGRAFTRELFSIIITNTPSTPIAPGTVTISALRNAYESLAASQSAQGAKEAPPFDEIIVSAALDARLDAINSYTSRVLATKEQSSTGHLFINGKHFDMTGQWLMIAQQEIGNQLGFLASKIVQGAEIEDISNVFYDLPSTLKRRSRYLIPDQSNNKLKVFNLKAIFEDDTSKKLNQDFLYNQVDRGAPITTWVIGDLDTAESRKLIDDALSHLQKQETSSRLGFIHVPNPSSSGSEGPGFSTLLYHQLMESQALQKANPAQLQILLREYDKVKDNVDKDGKILSEDSQQVFEGIPLHALSASGWAAVDVAKAKEFWDEVGSGIGKKLDLRSSEPHLLLNGRLIGPIKAGTFGVDDFEVLEVYELAKRTKPVIDLLATMIDTRSGRATLASKISAASSIIASSYGTGREGIFEVDAVSRDRYFEKLDKTGALSFKLGDENTALLHVAMVVDPISKEAQQWSSFLRTLSTMNDVAVSVYLQPQPITKELNLKRFYRFSLSSGLQFDVDGQEAAPQVTFEHLPGSPIMTLGMDTPPAWIVRPETSPHDLDNLVLDNIHEDLHILFNLNQILIEGHAREGNNVPPRGLQLQLTNEGLGMTYDTQVMANLGYFQYKVTPGVYELGIRPGRGQEVYEVDTVGAAGWDSLRVNETGSKVALTSFEGLTILPKFNRKEGMEAENVLIESAIVAIPDQSYPAAVFSRMKELVGLSSPAPVPAIAKSRHADINIFTVASGLLYERFASIMILSVMKNTQSSVKFWFIENFLSPTFLEFIPQMAEEYGFQYEFVTYKWPHWLHAQTEKQRIIWAYKILFLDVLFPMDLDKVIFVDADQIVRTDMKDLVDLDLRNHVYGYPPMGDDRTEMEGFRFWKTGYWRDALRGRPYHISALYVVDLKLFRQRAAGDRLRGQYHALSQDPNSLANLDQDLPNSMQDQIPIFTLDKDWLWCQTWCSDESLATAKTIDLCQNPLTKEPKLKRARQIPEWDVYDREIAEFAARISGNSLAASVDELAGTKSDKDAADDRITESVAGEARLDDEAEREQHQIGTESEVAESVAGEARLDDEAAREEHKIRIDDEL